MLLKRERDDVRIDGQETTDDGKDPFMTNGPILWILRIVFCPIHTIGIRFRFKKGRKLRWKRNA